MSRFQSSTVDSSAAHQRQVAAAVAAAEHRLPSKRKLDDYASFFDDEEEYDGENPYLSDLISVKMRKDEPNAVNSSSDGSSPLVDSRASYVLRPSSSSSSAASSSSSAQFVSRASARPELSRLQFFIRMMSEGNTTVVHANPGDSVKSLHERIQVMTGIPVIEQRLIYRGKQLQWEQTLAECAIQNDAGLQLVGRMRSTEHPQAWQVIDDMVSVVWRLCRGEMVPSSAKHIKNRMTEFLQMTPKDDTESAIGHLQIFMTSSAPAALVMLYVSPHEGNKYCADISIKHFLNTGRNVLSKPLHNQCAPIILEFCKLLRRVAHEEPLYQLCRSTLGSLLENVGISSGLKYGEEVKGSIIIKEIFPFVRELGHRLVSDLNSSMESAISLGPSLSDVRDFTAFLLPLRCAILGQAGFEGPISLPLRKRGYDSPVFGEEIECLHVIFMDLLIKMDECLIKMVESLAPRGTLENEYIHSGWSQYLAILKELNGISKLYKGAEEKFWDVLRSRKPSLCALIIKYAKRIDDHTWILEHKDVTDFEARRHLTMMMFPEVKEDYEELHEMLIDRAQLLAESFEYIARAEPDSLHGGLFMEFKNEEATGPGVLREWFFLVCQAIFNPENALFVACPDDRRRFYPNPASKVDPLHLDYFRFSGRVIALALMHKVQVGVLLDRVFFVQLAGMSVTLEDTKDADPYFYSSCKQILEMDADFIDSDALALTFVREIEELGSKRSEELCYGGASIVVNSRNRKEYVNLLIQNRFVKSISPQLSQFARGFADILSDLHLQRFFFESLELEDFDRMLYGSERVISVEDWKAHTEYNGYKETDPQIAWFWKIVGGMSPEQKRILLFFWTSVKHLPVEGFRGLASRLYIYMSSDPIDRLPSSHTCFYRICFPPYPSMAIMSERLHVITQEHIGCSFGTW